MSQRRLPDDPFLSPCPAHHHCWTEFCIGNMKDGTYQNNQIDIRNLYDASLMNLMEVDVFHKGKNNNKVKGEGVRIKRV